MGGGASGPLTANFDSLQANVFEPLCEHCHSGANAPAGLRLDADGVPYPDDDEALDG